MAKIARRAALLAAAMGGAMATPAFAAPTYSLLTTIHPPAAASNASGNFGTFDISFFDPTTQLDYVADRTNSGVDIYSGITNSYVGRAGGFIGQLSANSGSGPDGVVVASNGGTPTLFAGDGNSTFKVFALSGAGTPTAPALTATVSTGGSFRVDEMAYSPTTNQVLVANNADAPAFGTLVNSTTGAVTHANIKIPGAANTDGLEQPVWNPGTNSFFVSVPQFSGTGAGGVAEILPDGTVGRLYNFASFGISSCSPTGLVVGASGNLMVGCGNAGTQTVLLNPAGTGSIVKQFSQISGSDEIYYDPTLGDYFVTGVDTTTGRAFDVISDASDTILSSVSVPNVNAHSIAVDPVNGEVFVPLGASIAGGAQDTLCPSGCVAVYSTAAAAVPEPGTLPVVLTGVVGLIGLSLRRRRNS